MARVDEASALQTSPALLQHGLRLTVFRGQGWSRVGAVFARALLGICKRNKPQPWADVS
jgi:hypothetical protein